MTYESFEELMLRSDILRAWVDNDHISIVDRDGNELYSDDPYNIMMDMFRFLNIHAEPV